MQTVGWLFDIYPLGERLVLWFITADGQRLRVEDDFPYCIYLGGPQGRIRALARALGARGWVRRVYGAQGRDLWEGKEVPVMALELRAYGHLGRLRAWLGAAAGEVEVYNCDLDPAAYYLYTRKLWPCLWYDLEMAAGRLVEISAREEAFAVEFSPPPLTTLTLGLTRDPLIPLGAGNGVVLGWEGGELELEAPDAPSLVAEVARIIKRLDPDVILSDWGDEEIIPVLTRWSREHQVPLPLDREPAPPPRKFNGGRSYFSYGRIVYQGPSVPFYGRWHVDRRNSFFFKEAGLLGLVQAARIGQIPLQQAARASPGTLITSMQLARAVRENILIPGAKANPRTSKPQANC
jgi:DNA polymerase-2